MIEPKRLERRDMGLQLAAMFDPAIARGLWESLPEECRLTRLTKRNIPERYRAAVKAKEVAYGEAWATVGINFRDLPESMQHELAWLLFREIELGRFIHPAPWSEATRVLRAATAAGTTAGRSARSLLDLNAQEWLREARAAAMRDYPISVNAGRLEDAGHRINQMLDLLVYSYHRGGWWQLDVWNPTLDARIPRRSHEPSLRSACYFTRINSIWMREAAKLWLSSGLSTGRYTWSTVKSRLDALKWLQSHINDEGDVGPCLVEDPAALRGFIVRFCGRLAAHRVQQGQSKGQPLGKNPRRQTITAIEQFYQWCFDNRSDPSLRAIDERWGELRGEHAVLFRPEDKPRLTNNPNHSLALEDEVMTQLAAGCEWIAKPKPDGGGDLQAFHALLLLMRTGRRVNEILMMDFDPLEPLLGSHVGEAAGFVARLRYQQTKIEQTGNPTIPVDEEVVSIIRAQQKHARELMASFGEPDRTPKYLFLAALKNRHGERPYPMGSFHPRMRQLSDVLDLKDTAGNPVSLAQTHRFRHTKATNLINGGVPLHVVMRYLGHVTPTMTMHYAITRDATMESEFLKYKKVTSDGRESEVDPSDLYDLLQLDKRADRILPNGWCTLPPKQTCDKGNACLSCSKFVTDASHADVLRRQREDTSQLLASRQAAFQERYGAPMPDNNVWVEGRAREMRALDGILLKITTITNGGVRAAGTED